MALRKQDREHLNASLYTSLQNSKLSVLSASLVPIRESSWHSSVRQWGVALERAHWVKQYDTLDNHSESAAGQSESF